MKVRLPGIFVGRNRGWSLERIPPPWGSCPSLYRHIKLHLDPDRPGLRAGAELLPDEPPMLAVGEAYFAPGALDGSLWREEAAGRPTGTATVIVDRLQAVLGKASRKNVARLYETLTSPGALRSVDAAVLRILDLPAVDAQRLHRLARWLAERAPDRHAVSFGLAMLSLFRGPGDLEIIKTLGRHSEFTAFAMVAIRSKFPDPDEAIVDFARSLNGGALANAVEDLAGSDSPRIKGWLLREALHNSDMRKYLAYTCATAGGLYEALDRSEVDGALLRGAGEILEAMMEDGAEPGLCIGDYEHAMEATERYIDHVVRADRSLDRLLHVRSIRRFVANEEKDWADLQEMGWTGERRAAIAEKATRYIESPEWRTLVLDALEGADGQFFREAATVAEHYGVDPWPHCFQRLTAGEDYWGMVMRTSDRGRIAQVVEHAQETMPLGVLAAGPDAIINSVPGEIAHLKLAAVLHGLSKFPGLGWGLIRAGMKSPMPLNRDLAISALAAWDRSQWPSGATEFLWERREVEPVLNLRKGLAKLLAVR